MPGGDLPNLGVFPIKSLRRLERLVGVDRTILRDLSRKTNSLYRSYDIKKRDGSLRHIDNPDQRLKALQRRICTKLLQTIEFPPTMFGGIKERTVRENALLHIGQPVVVTLDLSKCFPRIGHQRVFSVFKQSLGCVEPVARLLTQLTTYDGHIPQGAPTSTLVSNLCLVDVHCRISSLAVTQDFRFSQYVDDLTLSGANVRDHIAHVVKLLQEDGLKVNRKKRIKCLHSGRRQESTGIILNRKPSVRGTKYRNVRERIMNFDPKRFDARTEQKSIMGSIAYVYSVNGPQGKSLNRLAITHQIGHSHADGEAK
jgi:RNA-directed DNA polymerase